MMRISCLLLFLALPILSRAETLPEIAARAKPGILGVAVYDFQTGKIQGVNMNGHFLMMSTFKAMLAAYVLDQADAGQISLDQKVTLTPADLREGVGDVDNSGGGTFTVRALLKAAVTQSDNTAADALLKLVGGPSVVTAWLQGKGIDDIRLDRDERTIARDENGIPPDFHPGENETHLKAQIPLADRQAAFKQAQVDLRDTATPEAAVHFLVALKQGKLLSAASTATLLNWMKHCTTGEDRLRAGLPPKTVLEHKTGTSGVFEGLSLATNDMGIITLPDGRILAIAVFLANSPASEKAREKIIADCARAVSSQK